MIVDLRGYHQPSPTVRQVLECVNSLLGGQPDWDLAKLALADPSVALCRLHSCGISTDTLPTRRSLQIAAWYIYMHYEADIYMHYDTDIYMHYERSLQIAAWYTARPSPTSVLRR